MRAILTAQKPDGTFPEVGTAGRTVTPETTLRGIRMRAKAWSKSHDAPVWAEVYAGPSIYGDVIQ